MRDVFPSLHAVSVASGIALSYAYAVLVLLNGGGYREMLGASSVLAGVVLIFVFLMPESPR